MMLLVLLSSGCVYAMDKVKVTNQDFDSFTIVPAILDNQHSQKIKIGSQEIILPHYRPLTSEEVLAICTKLEEDAKILARRDQMRRDGIAWP